MNNRELFRQIEIFLTEKNYGWVVEQVQDERLEGQISSEKISTLSEVDSVQNRFDGERNFKKGQSAEFLTRDEYSDAEALVLLIEAARRAIIDPILMVEGLQKSFGDNHFLEISFVSESEPESLEKHVLLKTNQSQDGFDRARTHKSELENIIKTIRTQ